MKRLLAIPLVLTGVTAGHLESGTKAKYDLKPGAICREGYVPITTSWQHCAAGARSLGFEGDSVKYVKYNRPWGTSRPEGCFRKGNGEFHFNDGAGGQARRKDQILCILESEAPRAAGDSLETGAFTATDLEEAGPDGSAPTAKLPEWEAEVYGEDVGMALEPPGNDTVPPDGEVEPGLEYWTPSTNWTQEEHHGLGSCADNGARRQDTTHTTPWKWIAKLHILTAPGGWSACTGFFISKRMVMTAAHCTYKHDMGGWVKKILVCPGQRGDHRPFGCQYADRSWVKSAWIHTTEPITREVYDYSVSRLPDYTMWNRGVGYFGFQTSLSGINGVNVAGYPGEKDPGKGLQLWADYDGDISRFIQDDFLRYEAYTHLGMSGGPLWAYWRDRGVRRVVGVVAGGYCHYHKGVRITKPVFDFMVKYKKLYG